MSMVFAMVMLRSADVREGGKEEEGKEIVCVIGELYIYVWRM